MLQFKDKAREKERQKRLAARALTPKASTSTFPLRQAELEAPAMATIDLASISHA